MSIAAFAEPTTSADAIDGAKPRSDISPFYRVEEVAEVLQCSARNVWAMNDRGALPGMVRIGRLVRWRKRDIADWIDRGCPLARGEASLRSTSIFQRRQRSPARRFNWGNR